MCTRAERQQLARAVDPRHRAFIDGTFVDATDGEEPPA
jgi:hypothetical protein